MVYDINIFDILMQFLQGIGNLVNVLYSLLQYEIYIPVPNVTGGILSSYLITQLANLLGVAITQSYISFSIFELFITLSPTVFIGLFVMRLIKKFVPAA